MGYRSLGTGSPGGALLLPAPLLPLMLLLLSGALSPLRAQAPHPGEILGNPPESGPETTPESVSNREALVARLRAQGTPFRELGQSLVARRSLEQEGIPGIPGRAFILAVPLGLPGEPAWNGGETGLPLRFAAALSFIGTAIVGERNGGGEPPGPATEAPYPVVVFLGGEGDRRQEELGPILEALEEPGDSILWYLDLRQEGPGALEFGFDPSRSPSLESLLPIPGICETLGIPWSFDTPLLAGRLKLPYPAHAGEARGTDPGNINTVIVRSKAENGGAGAAGAIPGETLGELCRRYLENGEWGKHRERNYLLVPAGEKVFFIAELPLVLISLGTWTLFLWGILFFPRFPLRRVIAGIKNPGLRGQQGPLWVEFVLWACVLGTALLAFIRVSLYLLWAPAIIPAWGLRSFHRPLPRGLCLGALVLYLGILLVFR